MKYKEYLRKRIIIVRLYTTSQSSRKTEWETSGENLGYPERKKQEENTMFLGLIFRVHISKSIYIRSIYIVKGNNFRNASFILRLSYRNFMVIL